MSEFPVVPAGTPQLPSPNLADLTQGKYYLSRLVMTQATSEIVKNGKIDKGGLFVNMSDKDNPEVLGPKIDCVYLGYRAKAVHWSGGELKAASHDMADDVFKNIAERAQTSKFGDPEAFQYGPEHLLWVPAASRGKGMFLTYFCNTVSLRRSSTGMDAYHNAFCTIESKFTKTPKFSWFTFTHRPNTGVIPVAPTQEALVKAVTYFFNPPKDTREVAASEELDR